MAVSFTHTTTITGIAGHVTAADVNADGVSDLICESFPTTGISVFLGNGDGTFQTGVEYAGVGNGISVGDVNGDGKLDILTAGGGSVNVLLGDGNGTFQAPITSSTGLDFATNPTLVDVNHDGHLDVFVSKNNTPGPLLLMLGDGSGSFAPPTELPANGNSPIDNVAADFNGDGNPDVAYTNFFGSEILIYLGNGDGTFVQAPTVLGHDITYVVTAGDLNGDGKSDLVHTNYAGTVSVNLGNGDGTFQPATEYSVGTTNGAAILADVDGDGALDIAYTNYDANALSILLGNGDGTFQSALSFATNGSNPAWVAFADFDGDGQLDAAVENDASQTISILLNTTVIPGETFVGGNGGQTYTGAGGNDTISGGNGNDTLNGAGGNDTISGGNGTDVLSGGTGNDTITGGNGNDALDGGAGHDSMSGGNGTDVLNGRTGNDTLTGGNGADTFVFNANFGNDVISDFKPKGDTIQFDQSLFADFADVQAHAANDGNGNVVITYDANNTVTLEDITLAQLRAGDFVFV
jgi:Ca2+-binding RTX toxin-like protein